MASHDFLTGLWNRRRFEDELAGHSATSSAAQNPARSSGSIWTASKT